MRCEYCDSKLEVTKFKYKAKTYDGKRRQSTFKLCLDCQNHGVCSSKEKICKLWDEEVVEHSIISSNGSEMYAY